MSRVLIVDLEAATSLEQALMLHGFEVTRVRSFDEAAEAMSAAAFRAVFLVLGSDLDRGIDACRRLSRVDRATPLVAMGPLNNFGAAAALLAAGAEEFIPAPVEVDEVLDALTRVASRRTAAVDPEMVSVPPAGRLALGELIGHSDTIREVFALIERIASTDSTVLITGETGTGKELVARTVHTLSGRCGELVAVNCAGIPDSLLESELFGHARGAFTDARAPRAGLLSSARGGTLFLDEIGEMSLGLQSKLLRALQERVLRPVGSDRELPFDARIIAATSRDLEAEMAAGRFRADLFFRIDVIRIALPPLRARHTDVLVLAQHFMEGCAPRNGKRAPTLAKAVIDRLLTYPWPGNVRELQNCIERAVTLSASSEIDVGDLPERIRRYRHSSVSPAPPGMPTLAEVERRHIRDVLGAVAGKRGEASRILGIDRKTLYRKLERYGLGDPENAVGESGVQDIAPAPAGRRKVRTRKRS